MMRCALSYCHQLSVTTDDSKAAMIDKYSVNTSAAAEALLKHLISVSITCMHTDGKRDVL